jgi:decaprenylphospho-beta-D-ribofuranose 2-oxidase
MRGYTLTLDFPWSARTSLLLDAVDEIVLRHRGRVYLAKDARMPQSVFDRMQPNLEPFRQRRATTGAADAFCSLQSQRLGL